MYETSKNLMIRFQYSCTLVIKVCERKIMRGNTVAKTVYLPCNMHHCKTNLKDTKWRYIIKKEKELLVKRRRALLNKKLNIENLNNFSWLSEKFMEKSNKYSSTFVTSRLKVLLNKRICVFCDTLCKNLFHSPWLGDGKKEMSCTALLRCLKFKCMITIRLHWPQLHGL